MKSITIGICNGCQLVACHHNGNTDGAFNAQMIAKDVASKKKETEYLRFETLSGEGPNLEWERSILIRCLIQSRETLR